MTIIDFFEVFFSSALYLALLAMICVPCWIVAGLIMRVCRIWFPDLGIYVSPYTRQQRKDHRTVKKLAIDFLMEEKIRQQVALKRQQQGLPLAIPFNSIPAAPAKKREESGNGYGDGYGNEVSRTTQRYRESQIRFGSTIQPGGDDPSKWSVALCDVGEKPWPLVDTANGRGYFSPLPQHCWVSMNRNMAERLAKTLACKTERDIRVIPCGALARQVLRKEEAQQKQAVGSHGSVTILGLILALSILLVVLLIPVSSVLREEQILNENAAEQRLAELGAAEQASFSTYGAYVAPVDLQGNFTEPIGCGNFFLASGPQTSNPRGYVVTFNPGSAASIPNCSTQSYASFSINVDPTDLAFAHRHFYMGTDLVIHCNQTQPATVNDPVCFAVAPTVQTKSTTPPSPATPPVIWQGSFNATIPGNLGGATDNFVAINSSNGGLSTFPNVMLSVGSNGLTNTSTLAVSLAQATNGVGNGGTPLAFQIAYQIQSGNIQFLQNECVIPAGSTTCSVSLSPLLGVSGTLTVALAIFNETGKNTSPSVSWTVYGESQ